MGTSVAAADGDRCVTSRLRGQPRAAVGAVMVRWGERALREVALSLLCEGFMNSFTVFTWRNKRTTEKGVVRTGGKGWRYCEHEWLYCR